MYGRAVYQSILESEDSHSGVTIHLVDPEYDTGRILKQRAFEIRRGLSEAALIDMSRKTETDLLIEFLNEVYDRGDNGVVPPVG